jgi:type VI protein secretion system component Hcp
VLAAPAAHHGYLYIPGVYGSAAYPYRRWHEVDGYRLEAKKIVRSGRVYGTTFSPLSVGADLGPALPQLAVKCASGQVFSYVILRMHRAGESRYFAEFRLYNVTVRSVKGQSDADPAKGGGQSIEFDYTRMYMAQIDTATGVRTARTIDKSTTPYTTGSSVPVSGSTANDFDVFVRVAGIAGTSRRSGYAGWHDMQGYDIGVRRRGTTPVFSQMRVRSQLNSLPQFTMAVLSGQRIRNVEIHVWSKQVTTGPVMVIKLSDVLICQAGSAADAKDGGQTLSFDYGRVEFQYYTGGRGSNRGLTIGGWNVRTNTAL